VVDWAKYACWLHTVGPIIR